jgi:hypothetical protein
MTYPTTSPSGNDTACDSREREDAWAGQMWTIAAVSLGLEELHVNGAPPQFWLERTASGPAVYALKPPKPVALPQCLAPNVLLTQRGSVLPGPVKCDKLLAAPFVEPHQPYWDLSEEILRDERDLLRLEGTIGMSDGPHRIRLYQLSNVLTNARTLLVIDIKSLTSGSNSDGAAVGHN